MHHYYIIFDMLGKILQLSLGDVLLVWLNAIHIVNFIIVNDAVELLTFVYMKVIY